jgi:Leucine-rich repeat (LRR) protein
MNNVFRKKDILCIFTDFAEIFIQCYDKLETTSFWMPFFNFQVTTRNQSFEIFNIDLFLRFLLLTSCLNLVFTINLSCSFSKMNWGGLGQLYTCDVIKPAIITKSSFVDDVKGNHTTLTNNEVLAFRAQNHNWKFVPYEVSEFFPNVLTFQVINCNVSKVSKGNFYGFKKLTGLNLWNHWFKPICTIDDNTFEELDSLEELYLARNQITQIYRNTFKNLKKLTILHLNENQIDELPRNVFKNNLKLKLKLKEIFLKNNQISFIHYRTFENLKTLKNLDLRGNTCVNAKFNRFDEIKMLSNKLTSCDEDYKELKIKPVKSKTWKFT